MDIIIAGFGKVGRTIAKMMSSQNGINVTIIDNKAQALEAAADTIDAMLIKSTCLNRNSLIEAGAKDADLIISVTGTDETNILCCLIAKRLGTRHTIARVRQPEFAMNLDKFWKDLGLDMLINPEQAAAREISRLLRFPTADDIDTFLSGRVELVSFKISETDSFFMGKSVSEAFSKNSIEILLVAIERDNTAIIPNGSVLFEDGDVIRIIGRPASIMDFFTLIGRNTGKIKSVSVIGGSKITYYLATLLQRHSSSMKIKIIEISREKCEDLSERFPRCLVIHGDGTNEEILLSEVVGQTEAIVCLTDRDEENAIIALYSHELGLKKIIVKIDHINQNLVKNLGLGSIVSPKNLTAEHIAKFVRGHSKVKGSKIKQIHTLFSNDEESVEAVEFVVSEGSKLIGIELRNLKIRKDILIGCIARSTNIIIPTGNTSLQAGDVVIVIAKNEKLLELDNVLPSFADFYTQKQEG